MKTVSKILVLLLASGWVTANAVAHGGGMGGFGGGGHAGFGGGGHGSFGGSGHSGAGHFSSSPRAGFGRGSFHDFHHFDHFHHFHDFDHFHHGSAFFVNGGFGWDYPYYWGYYGYPYGYPAGYYDGESYEKVGRQWGKDMRDGKASVEDFVAFLRYDLIGASDKARSNFQVGFVKGYGENGLTLYTRALGQAKSSLPAPAVGTAPPSTRQPMAEEPAGKAPAAAPKE